MPITNEAIDYLVTLLTTEMGAFSELEWDSTDLEVQVIQKGKAENVKPTQRGSYPAIYIYSEKSGSPELEINAAHGNLRDLHLMITVQYKNSDKDKAWEYCDFLAEKIEDVLMPNVGFGGLTSNNRRVYTSKIDTYSMEQAADPRAKGYVVMAHLPVTVGVEHTGV